MIVIPQSPVLSTRHLNRVFDTTTMTYKYYWFLAILELFVKQGKAWIDIWDIMVLMVANAWYPVHYFKLSFGRNEGLYTALIDIQRDYAIPINIGVDELVQRLHKIAAIDQNLKKRLAFLQKYVPFRFLKPWIDTSKDAETLVRSQTWENGCLYRMIKQNDSLVVEINPVWYDYLRENYDILKAFAYWGLTEYLQVRNPNVPNISGKLVKKEERSPLTVQHRFWDNALSHGLEFKCMYTGKLLLPKQYDLDHFIPWSFVSHDLLWNLIPSDSSINSSKSNKLPDLKRYLPQLAEAHQSALRINLNLKNSGMARQLEDYLSLGHSPEEIISMDRTTLVNCFAQTFTPMYQIALNMGFEVWKH